MARFITYHNAPGVNLDTLEDLRQKVNDVAKSQPETIYYRSWVNLSKGKIMSECDALDSASLRRWFNDLGLPVVEISEMDLIGQAGMTTLAP